MSIFRRPKKQVRTRVVTIDPDADDNEMDDLPAPPPPPPPPKLSFNYETADDVKVFPQQSSKDIFSNEFKGGGGSKNTKNNTLLSFDEDIDDENEGEVFKVKKSSFSRRLIKQRDREKKDDKVNVKIENDTRVVVVSENKNKSQDQDFIRILNGREAEAVHMQSEDEDEDDDDDEEEDEENGTKYFDDSDHKFRRPGHNNSKASNEAVRKALENGVIPDAHMIHEARKRRQLARDNTLGTEFIPFSNEKKPTKENSRLVREEDDHEAEEDEEDDRLDFSKATNPNKWDAEKRREVFNAAEDEIRDRFSEGDSDPEMEAWERQQIRKGVSQSKMHNVAKEAYYETFNESKQMKNSQQSQQYSFYPTQASYQGNVKTEVNRASLQQNNNYNLQDIVNGKTIVSPDTIVKQLGERLEKLKLSKDRDAGALSRLTAEINLAGEEVAEGEKIKPELSNRFDLYQNLRGYVSDLVDMLRYKMRNIESIENRLLDLMKARRERLALRRRQDVEDHLSEVKALNSLFSGSSASSFAQPPPDNNKTRRAAEREGRRTRRRRQRELKNIKGHKDGLSSDDEEMEFEISTYKAQRESILKEASLLFEDVHDDFASLKGILSRFEDWRMEDFDAYSESYAFMCIPKLISPLIRLYLIEWDFLSEYIDLTKFGWMKSLLSFTARENNKTTIESLSTDPDVRLIPSIAEKTIVPYISKVINASWDPVSTSQTRNLQKVVNYLIQEISVGPNCKMMHQLLTSIVAKFKESIDKDIYMPIFSTTELANKCSPANIFFSRQFWSSVKLLDNMSAWTGLLSDRVLQTLALDWLLTRYILIGIRNCYDLSESSQRAKGVLNVLPRIWLSRDHDSELPNGLQQLVRCLVSIVQNADISSPTYRISIPEISIILKSLGANKEAELILRKYS